MQDYLFTSKRLGFRIWNEADLDKMTSLNQNDDVMEFFPKKPTLKDTSNFIERMNIMQSKENYCYFAVDILELNEFIGFIGLSKQDYLKELDPFVDIGWRLKKEAWGLGYATEGAKRCLSYGFEDINLEVIYSVAPIVNQKSITIMKKIGMTFSKNFEHPFLDDYPGLKTCALYNIINNTIITKKPSHF